MIKKIKKNAIADMKSEHTIQFAYKTIGKINVKMKTNYNYTTYKITKNAHMYRH